MRQYAILVMFVAASSACGSSTGSTSGGSKPPIEVGIIASLTGRLASIGQDEVAAAKVEAKQINDAGGILGRKLNLTIADSADDPNQGVLAAKQLLTSKHIDFLVPDVISTVTGAILPFSTQYKTISLSACSVAACGDGKLYPYQFSVGLTLAIQPVALAAAMDQVTKGGPLRVGLLNIAGSLGNQYETAQLSALQKYGALPVVSKQTYVAGSPDFTVQLSKFQDAGANALMLGGAWSPQDLPGLVANMASLQYNPYVFGLSGTIQSATFAKIAAPSSVLSKIYVMILRIGARTSDSSPTNPVIKQLVAIDPTPSNWTVVVSGLDSLQWYKWAVTRAGSTDPDKVAAQLSSVRSAPAGTLPSGLYFVQQPGWSGSDHTTTGADLSHSFALVQPSQMIDGTFKGFPLDLNLSPQA
jgi:branched-chain amino acid transport system substrate-binding protein